LRSTGCGPSMDPFIAALKMRTLEFIGFDVTD
jgi:hypothetical protein